VCFVTRCQVSSRSFAPSASHHSCSGRRAVSSSHHCSLILFNGPKQDRSSGYSEPVISFGASIIWTLSSFVRLRMR
jgi:hypothetical protein